MHKANIADVHICIYVYIEAVSTYVGNNSRYGISFKNDVNVSRGLGTPGPLFYCLKKNITDFFNDDYDDYLDRNYSTGFN